MAVFRTFEHQGRIYELATLEDLPATLWGAAESDVEIEDEEEIVPAEGAVMIESLSASPEVLSAEEMLSLSAQLEGDAIAFVYTELLFYDAERRQAYGPVYREPVMPGTTREVGGVEIPDWETPLEVMVGVQPFLRILTDGMQGALAFVVPETGRPEGGYTLEGIYQAVGGVPHAAKLFFDADGLLRKGLVFSGRGGWQAPHALTLGAGDRFTPLVRIFTPPDDAAGAIWPATRAASNTLIWGEVPFHLEEETLIPGEYRAGFMVRDLDDFEHRCYVAVTVS